MQPVLVWGTSRAANDEAGRRNLRFRPLRSVLRLLQVTLLDLPSARLLYHRLRQAKLASEDAELHWASRTASIEGFTSNSTPIRSPPFSFASWLPWILQHLESLADFLLEYPESNATALPLLIAAC